MDFLLSGQDMDQKKAIICLLPVIFLVDCYLPKYDRLIIA